MLKKSVFWLWVTGVVIAAVVAVRYYRVVTEARHASLSPARLNADAIKQNLLRLAAAGDAYLREHPEGKEVTGAELFKVNPQLHLASVEGEDYGSVTIFRDSRVVQVQLPNGRDIIVPRPARP